MLMNDPSSPAIFTREAVTGQDYALAASLFQAYANSVGEPSCFPDFENELQQLGKIYAPPDGGVFLAFSNDEPAGCCAFRPFHGTDHVNACEMKRLYVARPFRRFGLGHMLVEAVMNAAKISGYSCMLLDTLDEMEVARTLYAEVGFREVPPYVQSPLPGAHHLKALL